MSRELKLVTMNASPITDIRNTSRQILRYTRRMQRDEITNFKRNIETSPSQQSVNDVIEKLKTKSSISVQELNLLKNALFEDVEYTDSFLSVHGALRGLIRELTGNDISKQSEAGSCFWNLALGNNKACHAIAKTTGTYLVASLDSMCQNLAVTSMWTIGNLAASGLQTCEILIAQGAISKLTEKLSDKKGEDVREGALYALEHFVWNMKHNLSDDALQKIFQALKWTPKSREFSRLLFFMSCHPKFPSVALCDEKFTENLLNAYLYIFQVQCDDAEELQFTKFVYVTRTLANVCITASVCDTVLDGLVKNKISANVFNICNTKLDDIRNAQLWFLGNLLNFATDSDVKTSFFSTLI